MIKEFDFGKRDEDGFTEILDRETGKCLGYIKTPFVFNSII